MAEGNVINWTAVARVAERMAANQEFAAPGTPEHAMECNVVQIIDDLAPARRRAAITIEELRKIGVVKSGGLYEDEDARRFGKHVNKNKPNLIEAVTRLAFGIPFDPMRMDRNDEQVRMELLTALHGVRVPMASAVLTWVYPDRFGVIDRRAWRTLHKAECVSVNPTGANPSTPQWLDYLEIVVELSDRLHWPPQRVDFWLYLNTPKDGA